MDINQIEELTIHYVSNMNEAAPGRTYLVMVPNGWGKNTSAWNAYQEAKKHGIRPSGVSWAVLYDAPEDVWVDEVGYQRWANRKDPAPKVIGKIKVRRV